ncbi:MAG: hypothetical protein RIB98_06930 [Acidimicrobiales bacterium]
MTHHLRAQATPRWLPAVVLFVAALMWSVAPAAAQYGGGVSVVVDPIRVEIGEDFAYFGSSCPAGSTVTITIDGLPGIADTTIANDDSSFGGTTVPLPEAVVPGQDYVVRATCNGDSATSTLRAVCRGGDDPVDGECPGGTIGEVTTTTSTTPGGSGTGGGDNGGGDGTGGNGDNGGGDGTGGDGEDGGNGDGIITGGEPTGGGSGTGSDLTPALAVTGASFVEQAAQLAVTLVAMGAILVLLTVRRREHAVPSESA